MSTCHTIVHTELGELTVVAAEQYIVGVYFAGHWTRPAREGFGPKADADSLLDAARTQLIEYLDGERRAFELPTAALGDEFQRRVWALLAEIPYGATTTYGELARRLGEQGLRQGDRAAPHAHSGLAQAVGQAVGHNPLSIIVPCHRVVGQGGKLTGYAGGLRRKQFLLELEAPAPALAGRLF